MQHTLPMPKKMKRQKLRDDQDRVKRESIKIQRAEATERTKLMNAEREIAKEMDATGYTWHPIESISVICDKPSDFKVEWMPAGAD